MIPPSSAGEDALEPRPRSAWLAASEDTSESWQQSPTLTTRSTTMLPSSTNTSARRIVWNSVSISSIVHLISINELFGIGPAYLLYMSL